MFSAVPPSCPYCDSRDVRAAHFREIKDYVLLLAGMRPVRCRECYTRFHGWLLRRAVPAPEKRHYRPRLRVRIDSPEALRRLIQSGSQQAPTEASTVPDN